MIDKQTTSEIATEIEALHAALTQWLSGKVARDDAFCVREFAARLHVDFFNVQPAGIVLSRTELVDGLYAGHGASPAFDIRIRNVNVRQKTGTLILATYEEYQTGAQNSARANNARLSTVLFETIETRLIWRAIHETWLPDASHAAENFEF